VALSKVNWSSQAESTDLELPDNTFKIASAIASVLPTALGLRTCRYLEFPLAHSRSL
jgi:hypothetical protein